MANSGGWRTMPALGCMAFGVGLLASAGLLLGNLVAFELLGRQPLVIISEAWKAIFGLGALPAALLLAFAGAQLLLKPDADPWRLPWGRALGAQLALFSFLSLAALFLRMGPERPAVTGAPGLVGWALATASREAFGPVPAILTWLLLLVFGVLAAMRIGAERIAVALDGLADALGQAGTAQGASSEGQVGQEVGSAAASGQALQGASASPAGPGSEVPPAAAYRQAPLPSTRPGGEGAGGSDAAGQPDPVVSRGRARDDREVGSSEAAAQGVAPAGAPGLPSVSASSAGAATSSRSAKPTKRKPPRIRDASRDGPRKRKGGRRSDLLPDLEIFELGAPAGEAVDDEVLRAIGRKIEETLDGFGVPVELVEIERGPTFSRFGLAPGYIERAGQPYRVKLSRITALKHDLALALAAPSVRIEAPIPGRSLVGIEIPNPETGVVRVRSVLEDPRFRKVSREGGLPLAMGREVTGESVVADLARMPHLLVAGATGSGKSVFLNALLVSLLVQNTPDQLQLVLIDPKRVELSRFEGTPHLVSKVVTDPADAVGALRWAAAEMDLRYRRFADRGARDRATFNAQSPAGEAPVPALVLVIDELADLMMTAPEEVEPMLTRIAQMGRATGIHLVVATQRPSTDVVTGLIKANFPARLAFAVSSSTDSRVILDQPGAESLLGSGDMLYQPPDQPQPRRIQGVWVEDDELDRLLDHWRGSHWSGPGRLTPWEDLRPSDDPEEDLYEEAQSLALHHPDNVSASMLQRRLRIGYNKARALYQRLENDGFFEEDEDQIAGRDVDWVDGEFGG